MSSQSTQPKVWLVGAGAGDPDLVLWVTQCEIDPLLWQQLEERLVVYRPPVDQSSKSSSVLAATAMPVCKLCRRH